MHEVLVNRLGGLSLPRKSVVRLTDRPDMTLDVYRGRKTTIQKKKKNTKIQQFHVVNGFVKLAPVPLGPLGSLTSEFENTIPMKPALVAWSVLQH